MCYVCHFSFEDSSLYVRCASWNWLTSCELNFASSDAASSRRSFSSSRFRRMARKSCRRTQKFTCPSTTWAPGPVHSLSSFRL